MSFCGQRHRDLKNAVGGYGAAVKQFLALFVFQWEYS
jgi:hypothetical protein